MIAFICAMPMELEPVVDKLGLTEKKIDDVVVHVGTCHGHDVVAIVTGMGFDFARQGIERLCAVMNIDRVFVVGITGALESDTPLGTLVVPEVVVNSATGREYWPEQMPGAQPHGMMWSTDVLITGANELDALRARGVVSLDMETAVLAECCEARGIPWSVFRILSDRANDGSIDEELFHLSNQDGTPNRAAIDAYFKKYPDRLEQMAKMGEIAQSAANAAADAAIEACAIVK